MNLCLMPFVLSLLWAAAPESRMELLPTAHGSPQDSLGCCSWRAARVLLCHGGLRVRLLLGCCQRLVVAERRCKDVSSRIRRGSMHSVHLYKLLYSQERACLVGQICSTICVRRALLGAAKASAASTVRHGSASAIAPARTSPATRPDSDNLDSIAARPSLHSGPRTPCRRTSPSCPLRRAPRRAGGLRLPHETCPSSPRSTSPWRMAQRCAAPLLGVEHG